MGLYYYGARWYDTLSRFVQPDSVIPNPYNPLDWNRYAYARSNPLKYTDPTGHMPCGRSCPGDWVNEQELNFGAAWLGDWNPAKQKAATEKIESAITTIAETGASILLEPADWILTARDCLSGNCSILAVAGALLPGASGQMGKYVDDFVDTAGQFHHIFSKNILTTLNRHETLGGVFIRDDFIVQGFDATSHNGYETWHRVYDVEVVEWLENNSAATPAQFFTFMIDLYRRADMRNRFPGAYKLLEMAMEEMQ